MYDVLSTVALQLADSAGQPLRADTHLGQQVGGQADIRKVTAADLVREGTAWGIRRQAASAIVAETLDQVLTAVSAAPGDQRVLRAIRGQAERMSRGEQELGSVGWTRVQASGQAGDGCGDPGRRGRRMQVGAGVAR